MQSHTSQDAEAVQRQVESYLLAEPVRRNPFLTMLDQRLKSAEPSEDRYWWVTEDELTVGFALQSSTGDKARFTADSPPVVDALAAAMHRTSPDLPAVSAEAWAAAAFAGCWTDRSGGGAEPTEGERLYALDRLVGPPSVPGSARRATAADGPTIADWHVGFCADVGVEPFADPLQVMSTRIADRRIWLWDDQGPVAMAAATRLIAGAARIAHVYTPPSERGNGYGAAITAATTGDVLAEGAGHCLLFTQLANATSNGIYRRMGYRPVQESLTYRLLPR